VRSIVPLYALLSCVFASPLYSLLPHLGKSSRPSWSGADMVHFVMSALVRVPRPDLSLRPVLSCGLVSPDWTNLHRSAETAVSTELSPHRMAKNMANATEGFIWVRPAETPRNKKQVGKPSPKIKQTIPGTARLRAPCLTLFRQDGMVRSSSLFTFHSHFRD
jgi:hypothetical protein